MKPYKEIENTRYIINRVFAESKSPATLIEQRVRELRETIPTLEAIDSTIYNTSGGSIPSKEEL